MPLASVLGTSYTANENRLEYSVLGKAKQAARPHSAELAATELERSATPPDLVYYYLMNKENVIHSDPEILAGKPVVRGTRLAVDFILRLLAAGWTEQQLLENYPTLTPAGLRAVFAFAAECLGAEALYTVPSPAG